jgi:hypothetical protein
MELELKEVKYFEVDSQDLEDYINYHFPNLEVELVADNEWYNDSSYTTSVSKKDTNREADMIIAGHSKDGNYRFYLHQIMSALCQKDLIPEGDYLIKVCW